MGHLGAGFVDHIRSTGTRFEQEEHIYLYDDDSASYCNIEHVLSYRTELAPETPPLPIVKKQIFVLKVTGVFAEETPITVQCESDSTAKTIIQQVLMNAGKNVDQVDEYALIEELQSASGEEPVEQRVLPSNEQIMDAVACWNGSTRRFVLRKKGSVSADDHFRRKKSSRRYPKLKKLSYSHSEPPIPELSVSSLPPSRSLTPA
ncbi:unnamed protein product [Strongylus vulgaris]|uniref:Ras-associating domain-containing protein n=1 Tax=Strongylus vulgaris TaxID=40348 RepID=A0A3P7J5G2_STRVU|nr:unnamed protein product [Strongylus vulgaris]